MWREKGYHSGLFVIGEEMDAVTKISLIKANNGLDRQLEEKLSQLSELHVSCLIIDLEILDIDINNLFVKYALQVPNAAETAMVLDFGTAIGCVECAIRSAANH